LKTAVAGAVALCARPHVLAAQSRLSNGLAVATIGDSNVLCLRKVGGGIVLVDSGPPKTAAQVTGAISNLTGGGNGNVEILFNTHYHLDHTGNNEVFAASGARIIAHEHTRQWMSTDYWVPEENRWEKARAKAAWPTETFRSTSSSSIQRVGGGIEEVEYGPLPLAHTDSDIYVFFKTSNVMAVGDIASPIQDPALDWFTGAWIGGRIDAMDTILKLANNETRIVPAAGPIMSRADFKEERDMMEEVRARIWKRTLQGDSAREMLDGGVMNGLVRVWKDPYKFLYAAAKGMFAHHNKLDPAVI
jgi:glyoxylase-like metal-dependent hydrolase (beta-lactamase superfamily II)